MLAAGPELRITAAAAQTRMVSVATIRLVSRKSTRLFKGIIYPDISEFESHVPSHAVSLWAMFRVTGSCRDPHPPTRRRRRARAAL
jgi:hypothetical protein